MHEAQGLILEDDDRGGPAYIDSLRGHIGFDRTISLRELGYYMSLDLVDFN